MAKLALLNIKEKNMSSTILIHSSRYSQKVWGYDVYVNNQTGKSNVITFYGKLGKSMQKLTKRNK